MAAINLATLRKKLGLNQQTVGDRMGWDQTKISALERGKYNPKTMTYRRYRDWLVNEAQNSEPLKSFIAKVDAIPMGRDQISLAIGKSHAYVSNICCCNVLLTTEVERAIDRLYNPPLPAPASQEPAKPAPEPKAEKPVFVPVFREAAAEPKPLTTAPKPEPKPVIAPPKPVTQLPLPQPAPSADTPLSTAFVLELQALQAAEKAFEQAKEQFEFRKLQTLDLAQSRQAEVKVLLNGKSEPAYAQLEAELQQPGFSSAFTTLTERVLLAEKLAELGVK